MWHQRENQLDGRHARWTSQANEDEQFTIHGARDCCMNASFVLHEMWLAAPRFQREFCSFDDLWKPRTYLRR